MHTPFPSLLFGKPQRVNFSFLYISSPVYIYNPRLPPKNILRYESDHRSIPRFPAYSREWNTIVGVTHRENRRDDLETKQLVCSTIHYRLAVLLPINPSTARGRIDGSAVFVIIPYIYSRTYIDRFPSLLSMTVADSCSDSTPRFDSLGIINGAIEDGFEIGKIGGEKLDLFFEKKKKEERIGSIYDDR